LKNARSGHASGKEKQCGAPCTHVLDNYIGYFTNPVFDGIANYPDEDAVTNSSAKGPR